ncbi:MarC family protein [Candidatus Micrarchaeota archaeon]|nr:MarC family protein [Candidatus Micrarchaeota archaeon]
MAFVDQFIYAFVTLFVILDPFASIPAFLALTRKVSDEERRRIAHKAVFLAAVLAYVFLFTGQSILTMLGVSLSSFKIAGGIVLGLMGLETILGVELNGNKKQDTDSIAVLIATPLLTGPGVITTTILLGQQVGMPITAAAAFLALALAFVILHYAPLLKNALGEKTINIFSKIMGMMLLALAVEFIRTGLAG